MSESDPINQNTEAKKFFEIAQIRFEHGDYKEAIINLSKAIDLIPNFAKAFCNRATAKAILGDKEGAIADYIKTTQLNFNLEFSYRNLANLKYERGEFEESIKYFDDYIKLNQKDAIAYNTRGGAKYNVGLYFEALADFDQAIGINPEYTKAYNNRGKLKQELGDLEGALADINQAIQLDPFYSEAFENLGNLKILTFDFKEAIEIYNKAIQINSTSTIAYHNRGVAKIKFGDTDGGLMDIQYAEEIRKNAPYFKTLHKNLKLVKLTLINIGHFEKAEIDFNSQLTCIVGKNGTGKSTILSALGLALIGKGDSEVSPMPKRELKNMLLHRHNPVNMELIATGIDNNFTGKMIGTVQNETFVKVEEGLFEIAKEGKIILNYTVDNVPKTNTITLTCKDGRNVDYSETGDFDQIRGEHSALRYLLLGFPQQQDKYDHNEEPDISVPYPIEEDILPIINESELKRLKYFVAWVVNLERRLGGDASETFKKVVQQAFDSINDVLMEKVLDEDKPIFKFIKVARSTPPDLLVATADHPYGISIDYLSVGLKYTMGWIGFLFSRLYEANPTVPINKIREQGAIVLFDEIDAFIHPYIQTHLLYDLKEAFPNVQFIVSSHSPLSIAGLNREQIILLEEDRANQTVKVVPSPIDTWTLTVGEILRKVFDTPPIKPSKTEEKIDEELRKAIESGNESEIKKWKDERFRLTQSVLFEKYRVEEWSKYVDSLKEKQQELDQLVKKLSKPKKEAN